MTILKKWILLLYRHERTILKIRFVLSPFTLLDKCKEWRWKNPTKHLFCRVLFLGMFNNLTLPRKVRDSNSRSSYPLIGFRDRRIRPLCQLSSSFILWEYKNTLFSQIRKTFIRLILNLNHNDLHFLIFWQDCRL